jgi:hypothetical protein
MQTKKFGALLVVGSIFLSAVVAAGAEPESVKDLKARYGKIKTIHLVSHAKVSGEFQPGHRASGVLAFEYWADRQGHYRAKCFSSPELGLVNDMDIAFDGNNWQLLTMNDSALILQRESSTQMPVACPNPLFLPLDFLSPASDDCRGCFLKLSDFESDGGPSTGHGGALGKSAATETFRIEGPVVEGKRRNYEVTMKRAGAVMVPSSVRRLDRDGAAVADIEVVESLVADPAVGPLPIRMTGSSSEVEGDEQTSMAGTWTIEKLEVNRPIDPAVFTLNSNLARTIYDNDLGVFLKHPDDRIMGKPLKSPAQ